MLLLFTRWQSVRQIVIVRRVQPINEKNSWCVLRVVQQSSIKANISFIMIIVCRFARLFGKRLWDHIVIVGSISWLLGRLSPSASSWQFRLSWCTQWRGSSPPLAAQRLLARTGRQCTVGTVPEDHHKNGLPACTSKHWQGSRGTSAVAMSREGVAGEAGTLDASPAGKSSRGKSWGEGGWL